MLAEADEIFVKKKKSPKILKRKRMATEMVQMAMEMGMGGLMGELLMAEEYRRRGVQSTKSPSIAIIQKDSLSGHTVGVERK